MTAQYGGGGGVGGTQGGNPGPMAPRPPVNTAVNKGTKQNVYTNPGGAAALPSLDPAQTQNYYSQLQTLYGQYENTIAGLRAQRVGLHSGFVQAKAGIRSQLISGLAGAENSAIERGMTGGTADLQARSDVRGQASAAQATAKNDMLQQLAQNRIGEQGAALQFYQGKTGLEAQSLAQQQQLLAQQLQNNLIVSGQESQMDALKQMYQSFMTQFDHGQGKGGPKVYAAPPQGSGGTYAAQTGSGKPLY